MPFHTVTYSLKSGVYDGRGDSAELVWREVIQISNARWLRLRFGETNLGRASYLRIESLLDGSSQQLDAISLSQWYNTSAFFNGDAIEVQLFVAPTDIDVYAEVIEVVVGIPPGNGAEIKLHQNRPNPFNPITQISYALPAAGHTTLKIYDVLGREVAVLVNEFKEAGEYEVVWDASAQPSGVYFYKLVVSSTEPLQSGNFVAVKKMLLVR